MKKILILIIILITANFGFTQTRNLGMKSFINTDGEIKIAVKAFVSTKYLAEKAYLPFAIFVGCKSKVRATIERNDVVMVFKGKEYYMPTIKDFRKEYKDDRADLKYLTLTPQNIFPSEMGIYTYQKDVTFFPPRGAKKLFFTNKASINFRTGLASIVYFKNPGVKVGDEVIIKVSDHEDKTITGEITIKF